MQPIKLVENHPAFQRVAARIGQQVAANRQNILRLAVHNMSRPGLFIAKARWAEAVSEECTRLEYSLIRRALRKHGFAGKYVAH